MGIRLMGSDINVILKNFYVRGISIRIVRVLLIKYLSVLGSEATVVDATGNDMLR